MPAPAAPAASPAAELNVRALPSAPPLLDQMDAKELHSGATAPPCAAMLAEAARTEDAAEDAAEPLRAEAAEGNIMRANARCVPARMRDAYMVCRSVVLPADKQTRKGRAAGGENSPVPPGAAERPAQAGSAHAPRATTEHNSPTRPQRVVPTLLALSLLCLCLGAQREDSLAEKTELRASRKQ
jgi:hypothetical protein